VVETLACFGTVPPPVVTAPAVEGGNAAPSGQNTFLSAAQPGLLVKEQLANIAAGSTVLPTVGHTLPNALRGDAAGAAETAQAEVAKIGSGVSENPPNTAEAKADPGATGSFEELQPATEEFGIEDFESTKPAMEGQQAQHFRGSRHAPLRPLETDGMTTAEPGRKMPLVLEQDKNAAFQADTPGQDDGALPGDHPAEHPQQAFIRGGFPLGSLVSFPDMAELQEQPAVQRHLLNPEQLLERIQDAAVSFHRSGEQSVEVRISTSLEADISLQLTCKDGQLEASLRCPGVDSEALHQHWPELRRALKEQGIDLLDPQMDSNPGFPGGSQSGHREAPEPARQTELSLRRGFKQGAVKPSPPVRETQHRLLESWA